MTIVTGFCPVCSRYGMTHEHHIARRANDPDLVIEICKEDHNSYVHPRIHQLGLIPGMDAVAARLLGAASLYGVLLQRSDNEETSEIVNSLGSLISQAYGAPNGKARTKPIRYPDLTVPDSDMILEVHTIYGVVYDCFSRSLGTRKLRGHVIKVFSEMGYYARIIYENPARYVDFCSRNDQVIDIKDHIDKALKLFKGKTEFEAPDQLFRSHCREFLEYLKSARVYGASVTL